MDQDGLDRQVLFLNSPGIQAETDTQVASHHAQLANDVLKSLIQQHPTAKDILSHMGELPPDSLWRLGSSWEGDAHNEIELDLGRASDYARRKLDITTSGVTFAPSAASPSLGWTWCATRWKPPCDGGGDDLAVGRCCCAAATGPAWPA
ncbi:MAG: hypothetical protein ACK46L_13575 [Synechococcaceae cyanobacterium]